MAASVTSIKGTGLAIHIVADVLARPDHQHLAPLACDDHLASVTALCAAAGVVQQRVLRGPGATRAAVSQVFDDAATALGPDGSLILTFAGHSLRSDAAEDDTRWCLHDDTLAIPQLAELFRRLPVTAQVVVVADTCHAGAVALAAPVPQTLIVLAACQHDQWTINRRRSEFLGRLCELTFPGGHRNPRCTSYAWLGTELRKEAPDVELPWVWANTEAAMTWRPFALSPDPLPEP